mgnify:FL=1|tara:strand:+ start:228 stop:485 length:258 start_codon:yes stop_codon:yes gene_type:complete
MESFRSFITAAQKTKKCPEGYRFDKKLQVCVPIGVTRYYPYFGGKNGNGQDNQPSDNTNNNTNANGTNGNGSNGNGTNGNGNGGE